MPASSEALAVLPRGVDLHGRPAAQLVRAALRFQARIAVATDRDEADAKSLLAVLALGAKAGTRLRLRAEGDDALVAVQALGRLVTELRD